MYKTELILWTVEITKDKELIYWHNDYKMAVFIVTQLMSAKFIFQSAGILLII